VERLALWTVPEVHVHGLDGETCPGRQVLPRRHIGVPCAIPDHAVGHILRHEFAPSDAFARQREQRTLDVVPEVEGLRRDGIPELGKAVAGRDEFAPANPPKRPRKRHTVWKPDQIHTFLMSVQRVVRGALTARADNREIRRGQICGLKWSAVDLDTGEITIHDNRMVVGGRARDKAGGKTHNADKTVSIGCRQRRRRYAARCRPGR
jgi:hypothetical protein